MSREATPKTLSPVPLSSDASEATSQSGRWRHTISPSEGTPNPAAQADQSQAAYTQEGQTPQPTQQQHWEVADRAAERNTTMLSELPNQHPHLSHQQQPHQQQMIIQIPQHPHHPHHKYQLLHGAESQNQSSPLQQHHLMQNNSASQQQQQPAEVSREVEQAEVGGSLGQDHTQQQPVTQSHSPFGDGGNVHESQQGHQEMSPVYSSSQSQDNTASSQESLPNQQSQGPPSHDTQEQTPGTVREAESMPAANVHHQYAAALNSKGHYITQQGTCLPKYEALL